MDFRQMGEDRGQFVRNYDTGHGSRLRRGASVPGGPEMPWSSKPRSRGGRNSVLYPLGRPTASEGGRTSMGYSAIDIGLFSIRGTAISRVAFGSVRSLCRKYVVRLTIAFD